MKKLARKSLKSRSIPGCQGVLICAHLFLGDVSVCISNFVVQKNVGGIPIFPESEVRPLREPIPACTFSYSHPSLLRVGAAASLEYAITGKMRPGELPLTLRRNSKNTANIINLCEKCKSYLNPTINLFSRGLTCNSSSEQLTYL